MNQRPESLAIKIWGDYACFTRPEMKVERVSYPLITPSAARGVLEAVFWKPEFSWAVKEIHLLKPIIYMSMVRNEVKSRQTENVARRWARTGGGYNVADDRTQRHTLALRDVAYVVRAQMVLRAGVNDHIAKYQEQFRRRVTSGRCFATPYLGCREFSASFGVPDPTDRPIPCDDDLGLMLLDVDYDPDGSGRGTPRFFHAVLEAGIVRVPDRFSEVT